MKTTTNSKLIPKFKTYKEEKYGSTLLLSSN